MLDAIIISDTGNDTFSISSSLRLKLDGRPAVIQNIINYLENDGKIVDPVKWENENNWHCAPKLNGIFLLSHLLKDGFTAELIDSYYNERDRFIELLGHNPKAVVISTTFISNKCSLHQLVADIRSLAGDITIIAGGPFVYSSYLLLQRVADVAYDTTSPSEHFLFLTPNERPDVNLFIIDTKGAVILSRALEQVRHGQRVSGLPKTAYWDGERYIFSNMSACCEDPDNIIVDWSCIPDRFFSNGVMNVQASNGCPFRCEFCNFVKEKKDAYVKPLDTLIAELLEITRRGIRYVRFVDDNFRLGRNDLNQVCRAIIEAKLNIKWMSFIRASALKDTDLNLLKRAGCIEVQMGVESADRRVLKNMSKNSDPEMYLQVIGSLLDIGINCSCCFIAGFPGETAESLQATLDFIERIPQSDQLGLFYWSIYPFLLVPLSPVYEPSRRSLYNLSGYMDKWKHFSMDSSTVRTWIRKAFCKIKNSSPIYSGDNLDLLSNLSLARIKKFLKTRHNLEKQFLGTPVDKSSVIKAFSDIF